MELVVSKANLQRELQLLQGIVERKITIPVLANVLVEADGNEMRLSATDLDFALRTRCEASVEKPGTITIPAKKFFEIVRALPETDVRIEEDKTGVKIAAERFESRMSTLPPDDFPALPKAMPDVATTTLPVAGLKHMIGKTLFASSAEDTRYFLNGGLLVLKGSQMSLVATDGHRLALVKATREGEAEGEETKDIIPKKALQELSRLIGESDAETVTIGKGENHLFVEVGGRLLISRLVDGQYPAYDRVIPKSNDKKIEFDRDRLLSVLRRVSLLSSERSRAVKFHIGDHAVKVTSDSPDMGSAEEVLPVDYDGPDVQICFNVQYVQEFLGAVETERVVLEFKDEVSQAVMKPIEPQGYDYLYVVMPMRL
ncbi:MAG: DNA polymerase III subunit beta [Vicinamibacteraceae bacterium]|nr:DNA polymerase III subunit beta [Vicinamibacteraceae bacterium]